jgi:hypothetical protein
MQNIAHVPHHAMPKMVLIQQCSFISRFHLFLFCFVTLCTASLAERLQSNILHFPTTVFFRLIFTLKIERVKYFCNYKGPGHKILTDQSLRNLTGFRSQKLNNFCKHKSLMWYHSICK